MDEYMENSHADQIDVLAGEDTAAEMEPVSIQTIDPEQQEASPSEILEVISIDELLQRLDVKQLDQKEESVLMEEDPEDSPAVRSAGETDPMEIIGQQIYNVVEYVTRTDGQGIQHYWKTTDLNDLTVSELMLILIFIVIFFDFCIRTIRRWLP